MLTIGLYDDEYLRCFRCGQESEVVCDNGFWIRCMAADCNVESPVRMTEEDALNWWNEHRAVTTAG